MNPSKELQLLRQRLPELEWQLGKIGYIFPKKAFPAGLFREHPESPIDYVLEIKEDINKLAKVGSTRAALYLAEQLHRKINVLVALCTQTDPEKSPQKKQHFSINQITTRKQWMHSLEAEIHQLKEQKRALTLVLEKNANSEIHLNLSKQLGEIEKKLTLAEENYARLV